MFNPETTYPPGSKWSNRSKNNKLFKNIGESKPISVGGAKAVRWYFSSVFLHRPKEPAGGYSGFRRAWLQEVNIGEELAALRAAGDTEDHVYWVGHATQLLCLGNGTNIIFDPIFSSRCSPSKFLGPRRRVPPCCSVDELPPVHIVAVSHNHFDHMDKRSLRALHRKFPDAEFLVPLRCERHLRRFGVDLKRVVPMDWWEERTLAGVRAAFVPAHHYGFRSGVDKNKKLWGGWVFGWLPQGGPVIGGGGGNSGSRTPSAVGGKPPGSETSSALPGGGNSSSLGLPATRVDSEPIYSSVGSPGGAGLGLGAAAAGATGGGMTPHFTPTTAERRRRWMALKTYYFSGDTAFSEDMFVAINQQFGRFTMAALPIGAYSPRWYLRVQHIDPQEAVDVFKILHVERAFGVHWGTFVLSDEPFDQPPADLNEALEAEGLSPELFCCIQIGGRITF